ncbi:hypothetical protein [Candidatus Phyllobacterium onerii]|nr:hypothetical protein [Phyllobacterium sp. IY22]
MSLLSQFDVAASTRAALGLVITYILVAIAYAIFMTTLLWPRHKRSLG